MLSKVQCHPTQTHEVGFPNLSTFDIWGWVILCSGGLFRACLPASSVSIHELPVETSSQGDKQTHCQALPNVSRVRQNCPWLRITDMERTRNSLCCFKPLEFRRVFLVVLFFFRLCFFTATDMFYCIKNTT